MLERSSYTDENKVTKPFKSYFRELTSKSSAPLEIDKIARLQKCLREPTIAGMHDFARTVFPFNAVDKIEGQIINSLGADRDDPDSNFLAWTGQSLRYGSAINRKASEMKAETGARNALLMFVNERIAWTASTKLYSYYVENPDITRVLNSLGVRALQDSDYNVAWSGAMIQAFASNLTSFLEIRRKINQLNLESSQIPYEKLRERNNSLYGAIQELQVYGVKSAIAPGLTPFFANEWLVSDPQTESEGIESALGTEGDIDKISPTKYRKPYVASFTSTDGKFKTSNPTWISLFSRRNRAQVIASSNEGLMEAGSSIGFSFNVGTDGKLHTPMGQSYQEFFASTGDYLVQEGLRAEVLSLLSDYMVPVSTSRMVGQELDKYRGGSDEAKKLHKTPEWSIMVLARERVYQRNKETIIDVLENGGDEVEVPMVKLRRKMRKHKIPGKVVGLREGHRASENARALALEAGFILPPTGATWRKEHTRGSEEEPLKYRVRLKEPSDPRKEYGIVFENRF